MVHGVPGLKGGYRYMLQMRVADISSYDAAEEYAKLAPAGELSIDTKLLETAEKAAERKKPKTAAPKERFSAPARRGSYRQRPVFESPWQYPQYQYQGYPPQGVPPYAPPPYQAQQPGPTPPVVQVKKQPIGPCFKCGKFGHLVGNCPGV
jgi:hypothetical protein